MKKFLLFLLVLVAVIATPIIINILQNGFGEADGRSVDEILGVSASSARVEHVEALSKADIMQLFYAAKAPKFKRMSGEYQGIVLEKGVLAKAGMFFTHHLMGPGRWEGKAFTPAERKSGWGYNMFSIDGGSTKRTVRVVKMDTFLGPSVYDDKESLHLVYENYNYGSINTMRDEIRQINPKLFLGYGYMGWSGGKYNPAPFVLIGPPSLWVGLSE